MSIRNHFSSQLLLSLRNVGWMFFDKIFRMGTSLLVGIWLARYLGPEQYGLLNYAYVFPLILSALVSLGINTLLISEIPLSASSEQTDRLVLTSVILRVMAGLLSFCIVLIANYYIHQNNPQLITLVAISASTLLFQGFDAVDIYFQSIRRVHYSIIPKVAAFILATFARIYGLVNGLNLGYFISITVVELAVGSLAIYAIYLSQRQVPFSRHLFDKHTANRLLRLAWPIMMAEFFIFVYMRLDQLMIKYLATTAELGKYSAALRVSEAWYFVAGAITASAYPAIIALRSSDYAAYLRHYQSLLNILAILGLAISLIFSTLAEPITHLLYGAKFIGVGLILSIHIWTGVFIFLAVGSNNWFVVENLQKLLLIRTIAGALLNVILNFFLIPAYGAVGASIATLIAQIGATYLTNGVSYRTKEVFVLQTNALFFIPRWVINFFRRTLTRVNVH